MWEYAVLPVLVAARLLVSPLGDFDLFVGARQCTIILPGERDCSVALLLV